MDGQCQREEIDVGSKPYGGYDSILRSRLSSISSDNGNGYGTSNNNDFAWEKVGPREEYMVANPREAIPLHWKSIPMGWK